MIQIYLKWKFLYIKLTFKLSCGGAIAISLMKLNDAISITQKSHKQ